MCGVLQHQQEVVLQWPWQHIWQVCNLYLQLFFLSSVTKELVNYYSSIFDHFISCIIVSI